MVVDSSPTPTMCLKRHLLPNLHSPFRKLVQDNDWALAPWLKVVALELDRALGTLPSKFAVVVPREGLSRSDIGRAGVL